MTAKPHDARARIAEARRRKQNAELNALMDEVDAELEADRQAREAHSAAAPEPEPTEEEVRHAMRVEAHQIAGSVRLPKGRINQPDRSIPAPIGPDSSSKDIAAQVRL